MIPVRYWTLLLIAALAPCGSSMATEQKTTWLAIVATHASVSEAMGALGQFKPSGGSLELVSTNDCANLRPDLVVVVAARSTHRAEADSATNAWRGKGIEDAYTRPCDYQPVSRIALAVPLLHPSLADRPDDTVNWELDDAVSRVEDLGDGVVAVIVPHYQVAPNDIREGLRVNVSLRWLSESRIEQLSDDCIRPALVKSHELVALVCVTETAADNLLHTTSVYRLPQVQLVAQQARCRNPGLEEQVLRCQDESVDAQGQLQLRPREYPLRSG